MSHSFFCWSEHWSFFVRTTSLINGSCLCFLPLLTFHIVLFYLQDLLGPLGLMSANPLERDAAINSLSTLMSIIPRDTHLEFVKYLDKLPDRSLHNTLSESDIQVFHTPEGLLSSEQGVYVAESVAVQNTKHAKGRFRVYDDQDDLVYKGKTAKEEARELLLREEASIREKVRGIRINLSLMLRALGEIAIVNPVFTHSQLPSLVKFVDPLLRSPIVNDMAFETMVNLSRCIAPPLCNWAPEIATALRIIATEKVRDVWDQIPSVREEANERPSMGLFERIITGLSISCKTGPLPVDSFTFVFPVLYHVLGVVPAYQASIGPMLNELCLGLQPDELASALCGVYAKDVHVRLACLNAIKCIPSVAGRSLHQNVEVATSIWFVLHDPEKVCLKSLFRKPIISFKRLAE
ncbi:hypothetical protein HHK36_022453 [Tetracentron sinense]|uniref:Uncharacterized protein n=1 Tax=Tetracentron sinense TaxID=13715 RepID=A0A834YRY6_TETSI|nr:hypothetical protein HHK36_022453 [Tetracentron sinense]